MRWYVIFVILVRSVLSASGLIELLWCRISEVMIRMNWMKKQKGVNEEKIYGFYIFFFLFLFRFYFSLFYTFRFSSLFFFFIVFGLMFTWVEFVWRDIITSPNGNHQPIRNIIRFPLLSIVLTVALSLALFCPYVPNGLCSSSFDTFYTCRSDEDVNIFFVFVVVSFPYSCKHHTHWCDEACSWQLMFFVHSFSVFFSVLSKFIANEIDKLLFLLH